jgi:MFS superfamily sulfate permease-like transporter
MRCLALPDRLSRPKRRDRSGIGFGNCTLGKRRFIRVIAYTATLAVFAGLVYLLLGWLKMGWISHFLSGAVLGGFVFGFGIGLIVDQTPKILGVPKAEGSYFQVLIGSIKALPETSVPTLIVGAGSLLLLLLFRRFFRTCRGRSSSWLWGSSSLPCLGWRTTGFQ